MTEALCVCVVCVCVHMCVCCIRIYIHMIAWCLWHTVEFFHNTCKNKYSYRHTHGHNAHIHTQTHTHTHTHRYIHTQRVGRGALSRMNQCFRGSFAENELQSTGLYSPTHSFHIEWLLHSVPANNTLSRRANTVAATHMPITHTHHTHITHTYTHTYTHIDIDTYKHRGWERSGAESTELQATKQQTTLSHTTTQCVCISEVQNKISEISSSSFVYERYVYDKVCIGMPISI